MNEKELNFILQEGEGYNLEFKENHSDSIANCAAQTPNCFLKSGVENILIEDCFLNAGSLDQMPQFNFNASAKYGVSLSESCGDNFLACSLCCLNSSDEITAINSLNPSLIINSTCSKEDLEYLIMPFAFFFNSSNACSGENNCKSRNSALTIINLTGLSLKNDTSILASTTNLIYQSFSLYFFHIPSLIFLPSFKQSSSVSSEFSSILSNLLSNNALLTFLDKNSLTDSDQFNSGKESISYFNFSGIDNVMFDIAAPPVYPVEAVQIYKGFVSGANILVDIFSNRIEITNPGGLVKGITKRDLGKKSMSRNNLLFGLMQRMNLVEKVGSGILRMKQAMKKYGLNLKFEINENWFTAVFERPKKTLMETTQKTTQKILELIKENPYTTRKELASAIGISEDGIKFHINNLKKKGLLKRIGPDKGGYWKIIKRWIK